MPRQGGVILAANHQSFLDPPAVGLGLSRQVYFVARSSLFRGPLLKWWFRAQHAVPIERGTSDLAAIRLVVDILRQGNGLVLFPEGTRTQDGEMNPFRAGAGILAADLDLPVVPIRIDGLWELKKAGKRMARPGSVTITIGPPIRYGRATEASEIALDLFRRVSSL